MKAWAKIILSLTLICYLAVSGVASVHAFSSNLSETSPILSHQELSPNCHQKVEGAKSKALSTCKIFCAAMGNIIIEDIVADLPSNRVTTEIGFINKDFAKLSLAMEPHPPR